MDESEHNIYEVLDVEKLMNTSIAAERKPDPVKHQYLTIEESLQFLNIPKHVLFQQVAKGLLRPCFLYDGKLLGSVWLGHEQQVFGYFMFTGYITSPNDTPIISYLQNEDQAFELAQVRPVELLIGSGNPRLHVAVLNPEDLDPELEMRLYDYPNYTSTTHKICSEDLTYCKATFKPSHCMLLLTELEKVRESLNASKNLRISLEEQQSSLDKTKSYSDKKLFAIIVPTIVRYIRLRDQIEFYPEADGNEGLRAEVKKYLQLQPDLKFLVTNFKDNWQKVICDSGVLIKIFDEN